MLKALKGQVLYVDAVAAKLRKVGTSHSPLLMMWEIAGGTGCMRLIRDVVSYRTSNSGSGGTCMARAR